MNTYLSHLDYQRSPTGNETATLVGNSLRLSHPVNAGDTAIFVTPNTTVQLNAYDQLTIFDGSSSEVVTVGATVGVGSASFQVASPGFQFAHASGVPLCSDGTQGSLAQTIIDACAALEAYCRQPLLQATYTSEALTLRTTRAMITRDRRVLLRPRRFPVQSISALALQIDAQTTYTLDPTQAQIDSDAQLIKVAQINPTASSQAYYSRTPLLPTTPGQALLTYIAGYVYAQLPYDIRRAAVLLTSELLSDRRNPTGAAELQQGKQHLVTRLRGDTSGDSLLTMRAHKYLDPYRQRAV